MKKSPFFIFLIIFLFLINVNLIFASQFGYDTDTGGATATTNIYLNDTLDTNDTARWGTLQGTDCSGTDKMVGVDDTGAVVCAADETAAGNSSFNESYADTIYSGIIWGYNQSSPYDKWFYNQSTGTYNMYGKWWYNMTTPASGGNDNVSWNESYADGLYGSIEYGYNQSLPYDKWFYNQTEGLAVNATQISFSNGFINIVQSWIEGLTSKWKVNQEFLYNDSDTIYLNTTLLNQTISDEGTRIGFNSTYNETYDKWSHNETTASISYTDSALEANNDSWLSTYNATYANNVGNVSFNESYTNELYAEKQWGYNQSLPYEKWFYNQTDPSITYTDSALAASNSTWSSTYNATYAANTGNASWNESYGFELFLNRTSEDNYLTTSNATYDTWAHNETDASITYTDAALVASNDTWSSTYNATYANNVGNISWNESYADGLYAAIGTTGNSSWNESYANELYSSISYNQTEGVHVNATQMVYTDGFLTILENWFSSLFDTLFGAKTTDDLAQGSTNFYENVSFNESYTDGLYAASGTGNASWNESYADTIYADITYNHNETSPAITYTDAALVASNSTWSSTANLSYMEKNATTNLNMSISYNITEVNCIRFSSGGLICSG